MRMLGVLTAIGLLASIAPVAGAGAAPHGDALILEVNWGRAGRPAVPCIDGEAPLFAAGATPVTNGIFFPGTAVYDGSEFQGEPYVVERGCNIRFIVPDASAVANGHQILSFKRKRGRPVFRSKVVNGPGETTMITEHVKPGTYKYLCTLHTNMYGILEFRRADVIH